MYPSVSIFSYVPGNKTARGTIIGDHNINSKIVSISLFFYASKFLGKSSDFFVVVVVHAFF